jgi:hypothetical protein
MFKSRRMRWVGNVAYMKNRKVERAERRSQLLKSKHSWEENIRMDLGEIGWSFMNRIHVTQDRDKWGALVNTVIGLRVL